VPLRRCLPLLLVAACGGEKDDDAVDTDVVDTEVDLPDDTFGVDTDEGPAYDSDDTGRFYSLVYEGHGRVARNASFEATQALTAVWLKHGTDPGPPRCMYVQSMVDWEHDPERTTGSPIASALGQCPGCEFAFTVSFQEPAYATGFPTVYSGFEEDTDFVPEQPWSDTDAADDLAPPSTTSARHLTCETLTGKLDYPTPDEILGQIGDWRGIGLDVDADHDDDDKTGVVYTVGADNVWTASYDGWWNSATGELYWTGIARPAEYPLY
jgi:hypothetical protein